MVNVKPLSDSEKEPDKVFDVAKPGEKPAHANARPVIVGNKSEVDDPMVNKDKTETGSDKKTEDKLSKPEEPKKAESESAEDKDVKPSAKAEKADDSEDASDNKKDKQQTEIDKEAERIDHLNELVESKKYFVPISKSSNSSTVKSFILTFILVLIVGAVVLTLLIDAKVVDLNISLPFDLIKN